MKGFSNVTLPTYGQTFVRFLFRFLYIFINICTHAYYCYDNFDSVCRFHPRILHPVYNTLQVKAPYHTITYLHVRYFIVCCYLFFRYRKNILSECS